jgi:hypothetical protein
VSKVLPAVRVRSTSAEDDFVQNFDLSHVHDDEYLQVAELLKRSRDLFALSDFELGRTDAAEHGIRLKDPDMDPIKQRHRRVPPAMIDEVRNHLKMMLDADVIRPSQSPWSSPVVLVRKKDQSLRFCIDYRRLNEVTKKDAYNLPRIEETLDHLHGAKYFSCLDLKSGYWQMGLEEESKPLTAFSIGSLGFYEFNVLPFGLSNSPASFQRLMERCMGDLHLHQCLLYLDNIIVFFTVIRGTSTSAGGSL